MINSRITLSVVKTLEALLLISKRASRANVQRTTWKKFPDLLSDQMQYEWLHGSLCANNYVMHFGFFILGVYKADWLP